MSAGTRERQEGGRWKAKPAEERFWEKVNRNGPMVDGVDGPCWLWLGFLNSKGYGRFWFRGRMDQAHRASYEMIRGQIPASLAIDHLCRRHDCVNPAHMETVTTRENVLRGTAIWRSGAYQRAKTHCPGGHEYTAENTLISNNKRHCKKCSRASTKAWRARRALATIRGTP